MRNIAWLVLVFTISNAQATSLHSVSAGYENFNPLGTNAQKYSSPLGANLTAFVDSDFFRGNYQAVVSGQFMMLPLKSAPTGMSLMGFAGYLGLRTHPDMIKQPSWFSPTFAVLLGAMYTTLALPSSATSTTTNTGVVFAAQIVPGFDFPIWRQLGLSVTFPVTLLYGTASMVLANQVASVRYEL